VRSQIPRWPPERHDSSETPKHEETQLKRKDHHNMLWWSLRHGTKGSLNPNAIISEPFDHLTLGAGTKKTMFLVVPAPKVVVVLFEPLL
jgi:hypothetical protein